MARELARFIVVGGLCALLFFAINYSVLRYSHSMPLAIIVAYIFCFPLGYTLQRNFTFQALPEKQPHRIGLARYFILHAVCAAVVYVGTLLLQLVIPQNPPIASIVATGLSGAASFVVSRLWVFAPRIADLEQES